MNNKILTAIKDILLKILDALLNPDNPDELETPKPNKPVGVKAKLGIIVGHTKRAGGAAFNNSRYRNEYEYNSRVAELAKAYAKGTYSQFEVEIIKRDVIGISGAYKKAEELNCDVVIELHFNAFNGTVSGTETLTTTHEGDKAFGVEVQKMLCNTFDREGMSRGHKPISRSERGGKNVYSFQGYNCLVEPFFGDNESEARMALDKMNFYANNLVDVSHDFCQDYLGL